MFLRIMWTGGNTHQPDFMEYHYFFGYEIIKFCAPPCAWWGTRYTNYGGCWKPGSCLMHEIKSGAGDQKQINIKFIWSWHVDIERLRVISSPIETNIKFHVKFTSAWQARLAYKWVLYLSHSYSSSGISVQMDASLLGLYYRYASLWKITKVALQSERLSLNFPCGSEDLMMSSQSLYC